jgi:DNA-binding response OmpR family regulator
LLVDDDHDVAFSTKKGLEVHNFDVTALNDPTQAIADFENSSYDFHILDIRMRGMSGFELARRLWQKDPHARVCFLTSFEIYEDEARKVFKDLNTTCFIKKPITPKKLAGHLNMHLASQSQ